MLFFTIKRVLTKCIEGRAVCIFLFIKVLLICSFLSARPPMIFSQTARILVIDDFHPVFLESLNQAGIQTDYMPDFAPVTDLEILKSYNTIAVRSKLQFTAELLSSLPELKCIARGGAGMDNIDETYARQSNITLLNAPEGNRDAVAEHSIGLLLGISKQIHKSRQEVQSFVWDREGNRGWEIGGKTIGIYGFGNTGSSVARKLVGFGANVIAYDKYTTVESPYAQSCSLNELLAKSDVISFHVPLTDETRGLLAAPLIRQMKDGVVLINTSRGAICRTADVWEGINSGKIKSFASDVLENENLANLNAEETELYRAMMLSNQVIITPHVAGWTTESYERIASVLAYKIIEYTTKVKNI